MTVYAKMKKICDNIRLRTGGTALLNLDEIAEAIMSIGWETEPVTTVYHAIGSTFPPSQKPASASISGYDIDVLNAKADDIYSYIDAVASGKNTVTKEILGKDASGKYDMVRYIFANREHIAWVRDKYPKMYAWKNGSKLMYTESVSPRIGERAYDVPYIGGSSGTTTETVTVPAQGAIVEGYRWSGSGKNFSAHTGSATVIVPVKGMSPTFTIELVNLTLSTSYGNVYGGNPTPADATEYGKAYGASNSVSVTKSADYIWFMVNRTQASGEFSNSKVKVNGKEIKLVISTTSNYTGNIKQESTTTTTTETGVGIPIDSVKVATIASGATTNTIPSSRIIGGVEYVRSVADDVSPTVIYTDKEDSRNSNASITQDGITYNRYPMGDLGANRTKLIPIFIYANEHGIQPTRLVSTDASYQKYETKMCALVAGRFLRDLADGQQMDNPLYKFINENCMLIVIPVANPYGYNMNITGDTNTSKDGYYNGNNVNINRNYDTPGWAISQPSNAIHHGSYPGSENETQYVMNTMVESGAVVAMSLHGIAGFFGGTEGTTGYGRCAHQGQNPDGSHYDKASMDKITAFLRTNYGYEMVYYDRKEKDNKADFEQPTGESINKPDRSCKSPSYITQCGAYGGIVEFQPDDIKVSGYQQTYKGYIIENAYAQTLNLVAKWLFDYLSK